MKRARRLAALLLCLLLPGCAEASPPPESPAPAAASFAAPETVAPRDEREIPVYFDGLLSDRGLCQEDRAYLAPDALCQLLDLRLETQIQGQTLRLTLPGLQISGRADEETLRAEGRYLYTPEGCLLHRGRVYLPLEAFAKLFSVEAAYLPAEKRVTVDTAGARLMAGGKDYYTDHFRAQDLFWLIHIIQAEAGNQPLAGQIGVGNVVLNRVESPDFPDTVAEVVLQRSDHTVQFDPTANGSVFQGAQDSAVLAAYLALDGYSTVGESLYFLDPDAADNGWFARERRFVTRIASHEFYA